MIEIDALTREFGTLRAVDGLSLSIPKGELFCFLGPNGAGKTTTIKMLTGLLRPTSGTIRIGGRDITDDPVATKRLMGYIPDTPYLYERLTAEEFLRFTADLYDVPPSQIAGDIDQYFGQFGLQDHRNALIKDLSHGMRQRLIYCSVFLHNPTVLFVDEPLMGLDPYTIKMIKNLLIEKTRSGMTIFLTTHILALAEDIADRIGIIMNGSLVELGTVKELADQSGISGSLEDVFLELTNDRQAQS